MTTGEKLLLPVEWQARAIDAQQQAMAATVKNSELAAKLAAYEALFGTIG